MADRILISVIIPTFKPHEYLWECLDALCQQSFSKDSYEIVLILNGCKEPYESRIQDYMANHSNVNWAFFQTDQSGVSNARNIGLRQAKGTYLAFVDDDDFVSPTYLEELYSKASKDTISLCRPYAFLDGEISQEKPYEMADVFKKYCGQDNVGFTLARKFFGGPCMKLIHREIINGREYNTAFENGEDTLFMFLISDRFRRVSFTSEKAIYYRRFREGSAVTKNRGVFKKLSNSLNLIREEARIYFTGFPKYRFGFFFTRVLGACRSVFSIY